MSSDKTTGRTVPASYFIEQYRSSLDPWQYAQSGYEHAKYRATLEALPEARYANGLELGCSVGVFTQMLASRCDELLAVDVSAQATAAARERCAALAHVRFAELDLTYAFPSGAYDLVTFCELGYYFGEHDLRRICARIVSALSGTLVLVHWTPLVEGHAMTADAVHDLFAAQPALARIARRREDTYRLDVFARA